MKDAKKDNEREKYKTWIRLDTMESLKIITNSEQNEMEQEQSEQKKEQ